MSEKNQVGGFLSGGTVGLLGGLIGLGGAEFRLPILISLFRFDALPAIILNKAMSLVVVATALPFRTTTVGASEIASYWPAIINLLAGSLVGAWIGASWATRLSSRTLYRVIAVLLILMAAILLFVTACGQASPWFTAQYKLSQAWRQDSPLAWSPH